MMVTVSGGSDGARCRCRCAFSPVARVATGLRRRLQGDQERPMVVSSDHRNEDLLKRVLRCCLVVFGKDRAVAR